MFFLVLLITIGCNTMKLETSSEAYNLMNSYYASRDEKVLARKTVDISQYSKGLDNLSAWQEANNDLGNYDRPKVDFQSMFSNEEFNGIIREFVNQSTIQQRLDKNKLNGNIELSQKAKSSISFPYIFTNNGTKYALMYEEVYQGPESAAGGITMFRFVDGAWEDIFYLHLWIS
jgi:hypothetical protein